jgi:hypothetical protein
MLQIKPLAHCTCVSVCRLMVDTLKIDHLFVYADCCKIKTATYPSCVVVTLGRCATDGKIHFVQGSIAITQKIDMEKLALLHMEGLQKWTSKGAKLHIWNAYSALEIGCVNRLKEICSTYTSLESINSQFEVAAYTGLQDAEAKGTFYAAGAKLDSSGELTFRAISLTHRLAILYIDGRSRPDYVRLQSSEVKASATVPKYDRIVTYAEFGNPVDLLGFNGVVTVGHSSNNKVYLLSQSYSAAGTIKAAADHAIDHMNRIKEELKDVPSYFYANNRSGEDAGIATMSWLFSQVSIPGNAITLSYISDEYKASALAGYTAGVVAGTAFPCPSVIPGHITCIAIAYNLAVSFAKAVSV